MASIKFDRNEFEKYVKVTPEIERKIILFGTPVESLTPAEIEIEVYPNRPDLLSLQGFMRSFLPFLGKNTGLKKYAIAPPQKNDKVTVDPSVKSVLPYTACAIVKDIHFTEEKIKEIIKVQEKLTATFGRNRKKFGLGVYPLEKIAFPLTFEARSPKDIKFQPLEASKEMTGLEILQKHPTGKEFAHLLEGKKVFPIFVDAKNKILSMPPIINSHETGRITEETRDVFIECSGAHKETLEKTLNIFVTTLADMGGKIQALQVIDGKEKTTSPNLTPQTLKLSRENANKILGLNLTEAQITQLLARMGHEYKRGSVKIAAWRTDMLHEIDLIEDIAVAYGYDKFVPEIPACATIGAEISQETYKRKIAEALLGLGLVEICSYHLIKNTETEQLSQKEKIELVDSKTEYKALRPNLLIPALRILSENKDNEYPQKIFELGTVFSPSHEKTETGITEKEHLLVAASPANFTDLKQILEYLMTLLSRSYTLKETTHNACIDGRTGAIIVNNKEVGFIGEIHPETLRTANIKMPVAVFELSLESLF